MSQTFSIACQDCRQHLWIAQGSYTDKTIGYLYMTKNYRKPFYKFLRDHQGHNLIFDENAEGVIANYDEIEVPEIESSPRLP